MASLSIKSQKEDYKSNNNFNGQENYKDLITLSTQCHSYNLDPETRSIHQSPSSHKPGQQQEYGESRFLGNTQKQDSKIPQGNVRILVGDFTPR